MTIISIVNNVVVKELLVCNRQIARSHLDSCLRKSPCILFALFIEDQERGLCNEIVSVLIVTRICVGRHIAGQLKIKWILPR